MSRLLCSTLFVCALLGCDVPIKEFPANEVYSLTLTRSRSLPAEQALIDATKVTEELFGTPNDPRWPQWLVEEEEEESDLVDPNRLQRAAGTVSSEKDGTHQGLYREHCVACHGLAGSGVGPASLYQNPHPRDFRHGVFKWKSTQRHAKPTRADLRRLLERGVPGTAMPSFALLEPDDVDALLDYTIYLSVRGEVERRLMAAAIDELGYGEQQPNDDLRLVVSGDTEGAKVVRDTSLAVADQWRDAKNQVAEVPPFETLDGQRLSGSIARGRELFHGQVANCVGCHGPDGNGDSVTLDYNDWDKEYSTRIGLTPTDRDAMRPFRKAGALKPRPIRPRNLASGVYRGGGDAETLYRRITQGIAGTPMPSLEVVSQTNAKGLTGDQVWDVVRYVHWLQHQRQPE